MSDLKMDEVDQAQQRQIDQAHTWMKVIGGLSTLLLVFGIGLFILVMHAMEGGCPHKECPHHTESSPR